MTERRKRESDCQRRQSQIPNQTNRADNRTSALPPSLPVAGFFFRYQPVKKPLYSHSSRKAGQQSRNCNFHRTPAYIYPFQLLDFPALCVCLPRFVQAHDIGAVIPLRFSFLSSVILPAAHFAEVIGAELTLKAVFFAYRARVRNLLSCIHTAPPLRILLNSPLLSCPCLPLLI